MSKARLASYLIVLAATAVWSQQSPAPKPDQPAPPPIIRNPHSTKADLAVPLCPATFNDSLETDGIAAMGDKSVRYPIPEYAPMTEFSDEARRLNGSGHFEADIGLIVDVKGRPQDVCLTKSAGYGLDANAARAVQRYGFKPAKKDGKAVAARISVKVVFNLY